MAGLLDLISEAYMRNVGNPARQLVGGGVRGLLGFDPPEYADRLGMEAYRNAAAMGNAPGINAPVGAFKAAAKVVPEAAMFIGALAKTWDKGSNAKAVQMEKAGKDAREIWRETGNLKGPDGKWRQEIDDSGSKFLNDRLPQAQDRLTIANQYLRNEGVPAPRDITSPDRLVSPMLKQEALQYADMKVAQGAPSEALSRVLQHGKAFMAYPDMGAIPISKEISGGPIRGTYDPAMNSMTVGGGTIRDSADQARSTTLHELQHAIQQREGFARGGSPEGMRNAPEVAELVRVLEARADAARDAGDKAAYLAATDARAKLLRNDGAGAYRLLAGEAEARATQARMNMTPTERRAAFPYDSYDVPVDQLIVRGLLAP